MLKKIFITGGIALAAYVLNSMRKEFDKNVSDYNDLVYILNKFSETFDFNKIDKSLASENDLDEDYFSMVISMFDDCDEIESIILPD